MIPALVPSIIAFGETIYNAFLCIDDMLSFPPSLPPSLRPYLLQHLLDPSRLLRVKEGRIKEDAPRGLPDTFLEPVQKGFLIAVLLELRRREGGRE